MGLFDQITAASRTVVYKPMSNTEMLDKLVEISKYMDSITLPKPQPIYVSPYMHMVMTFLMDLEYAGCKFKVWVGPSPRRGPTPNYLYVSLFQKGGKYKLRWYPGTMSKYHIYEGTKCVSTTNNLRNLKFYEQRSKLQ